MVKLVRLISILSIILIIISGCSSSSSSNNNDVNPTDGSETKTEPQAGGTLRVAVGADAVNLGYAADLRSYEETVLSVPVVETLGRYNSEGLMEPFLAKSWEEKPEEKAIIFHLQEGIKFHDGTDFNAEAAKWNIDQFMAEGRSELKGVTGVEVTDEFTVKVTLNEWNNTMIDSICYFVTMSSPSAFKEKGKEWLTKNPVGTGAFQFESWERDKIIKYKKFDQYWQEGKPYLDAVEYHIIKDPMTASASFRAKEVDVYMALQTRIAKELEDFGAVIVQNTTGLGARSIGFIPNSVEDGPFANVKVRQALAHAVDREAIVKSLLFGFAVPTTQWGHPDAWSQDPSWKGFEYNPKKAKELLAEAGYPDGFKTTIITDSSPEEIQVMTVVQEYLSKIGIEANIETVERGRYTQITGNTQAWDGIVSWRGRADADVAMYMPRNFTPEGTLYVKGIAHQEEIITKLTEARSATDFEAKKKLAKELNRLVYEKYTLGIPLYITTWPAAKYPELQDDGINETHSSIWTPENAWLKK
jgi:peptide/nickel transport system substrate-binding protein